MKQVGLNLDDRDYKILKKMADEDERKVGPFIRILLKKIIADELKRSTKK